MLLAAGALVSGGAPAAAQELSLARISSYLNGLKTVRAKFTQINDDGSLSTGRVFIRRPGNIRFEYDPPDDSLVLAWQGQVAVFDPKSNQGPQKFPLVKTPLSLILAKKVDLGQANMVVGHGYDGTATTVVAQDPKHPEYGTIRMVFTADPVELRQWVVEDGSGQTTTVVLGQTQSGVSFPADLFNIDKATDERGF